MYCTNDCQKTHRLESKVRKLTFYKKKYSISKADSITDFVDDTLETKLNNRIKVVNNLKF
jgi:hypothetical protein